MFHAKHKTAPAGDIFPARAVFYHVGSVVPAVCKEQLRHLGLVNNVACVALTLQNLEGGMGNMLRNKAGIRLHHQILAARQHQRGRGDGLELLAADVWFGQHQGKQRILVEAVDDFEYHPQPLAHRVRAGVGTADDHFVHQAGMPAGEQNPNDAAVAEAVIGHALQPQCPDELIHILRHIVIVVYRDLLAVAMPAAVQQISGKVRRQQLHRLVKNRVILAVAVDHHQRVAAAHHLIGTQNIYDFKVLGGGDFCFNRRQRRNHVCWNLS